MMSRHDRTDTHMISERLWQHAQGLHRFHPDGALVLKGRHKDELPSLTMVHTQSKHQYIKKQTNK